MMKPVSLLMLAAMFGGFTVAAAQEVEVETDEGTAIAFPPFPTAMGGMALNCGGSFLGIVGDEVNDEIVQKLNLPGEYGAIINEVVKESAAEKAGLQKEDVIVGYNGTRVESMAQLRRMISETPTGRTVDLTIIRNGTEQHVKADLGTRPAPQMNGRWFWEGENVPENFNFNFEEVLPPDFEEKMEEQMEELEERLEKLDEMDLSDGQGNMLRFYANPNGNESWLGMWGGEASIDGNGEARAFARPRIFTRMLLSDRMRLGATVQGLSPQLAKYFKLEEGESGALVSEVHDGHPAAKAGLQAGDVITAIDGEPVEGPMDITRLISRKEGTIEVKIIRDGSERTIKVDLGSREQGFHLRDGGRQDELFMAPENNPDLSARSR